MADDISGSVASYLNLGRSPLAQLSSLMKLASEEKLIDDDQFSSGDDFIILDANEDEENQPLLTAGGASMNSSICTDSVQKATSSEIASVRDVGNKNDTVQFSHPMPLSPIQQRFLKDRESARDTLCSKLEMKGFRATFNFQQREVDIESKRENRHEEALDVIAGSVIEMELNYSTDLIEQMSQVTDIADGEQVILTDLPGSEDVLVVIDKTSGSMKLVGMVDAIGCFRETLNKSMELLDKIHKSQGAPASIHGNEEPRGTSAQEQTPMYSRLRNNPREEDEAAGIAPITDSVPVNDDSLDYLCKFKQDEIQWIGRKEGVSICDTQQGYEVRGAATAVGRAAVTLRNTIERVKSNKFSFEISVNMGKFAEATRNASKNHNCIIGYKQTIGSVRGRMRAQTSAVASSTTGEQKVKVTVVLDKIENQNANVIVNTTNKKLNLRDGTGVSNSLLQEAGDEIQQVLTDIYPHGMTYGDLAVSHSGRLTTCEKIYHGALPFHTGTRDRLALSKCYEWLVSLVFRVLIQASKDGFQTIAVPAFGTGALQYPTKNVAQLMFHAIDLFAQDERTGTLKEIFIVISRESKLEVKQLFLAHRLSHKLKTRQLAHPRTGWDQLSMLFSFFLIRRPGRDFGLPAYLNEEVRKRDSKCEVRIMLADTLVQIVNGGIAEACDVTGAVLLIWKTENITDPNGHSGLTSIDRNRHDWDCCRRQVADLKRVRCIVDTATVPGMTLIHTYSGDDRQASVSEAMQRGLNLAAKKGCYHVTVPVPADGSLAARPDQTGTAIASAVNRRSCDVYVVTVVIPDNDIYVGIVTCVARRGIVQEPPDVSKVSLVDSLWKVTFSRQHSFREMNTTAVDAVMVVTSDSEETNRNAAKDVERELHVQLQDFLHLHTNLTRD